MALVSHNINNLNGGVSRQPDESRFDNQVEEMINFEPFVAGYISRRNPLDDVGAISTHQNNMAIHSYNRGDNTEKYGIILDDNGLRVYDTNGTSKTVTPVGTHDVLTEWAGTNWANNISFLTVGDTTWILNKEKVARMTASVSEDLNSGYSAFCWIKRSYDNAAGSGYTYYITINDVTYSKNSINSDTAATSLATTINAVAGFTARAEGSIVYIVGDASFTFSVSDSWGDMATVGWKESISKIADLPASMSGFTTEEVGVITITGTDKDSFTSYHLKWIDDSGVDDDKSYWKETIAGGLQDEIDLKTMPAKLIRASDGTFKLGFNENLESEGFYTVWNKRLKGDDDSNPLASFIDYKISNMFFFRNRLGFTSEENVILSEVSSYYNFFATTALEVLDSDPIDVSVDSDSVAILRSVNGVVGSLTLWADDSQYVLSGGEILSPSTTRVAKSSSYSCDNSIPPVVMDNEIIFFNKIDSDLEVKSYSASSINTDKSSAESIATNVIGYLPSTVYRAVVASASNLLFLLDEADRSLIYVYKYSVHNSEKVMSSWFKWKFNEDIKNIEVLDNTLFLLVGVNGLAKIELDIRRIDEDYLDMGTTPYTSEVTLSKFNIETRQGTRNIREPFYTKSMVVSYEGTCDLDIINNERNTTKTIKNKHLGRKLFIGGNSNKISLKFRSEYNTGCKINTLSLEGLLGSRSQNL